MSDMKREPFSTLLDEWAGAACVQFVCRSDGQRTTNTVSRDDLMQLMSAVQAAEKMRCANLCQELDNNQNTKEYRAAARWAAVRILA